MCRPNRKLRAPCRFAISLCLEDRQSIVAKFAFNILGYGRSRRQTACANFAWTRLGFFQRSPEGFWKSERWRRDFAQRRTGPFDRQRDLQFEIANRRAPFLAPAARPR